MTETSTTGTYCSAFRPKFGYRRPGHLSGIATVTTFSQGGYSLLGTMPQPTFPTDCQGRYYQLSADHEGIAYSDDDNEWREDQFDSFGMDARLQLLLRNILSLEGVNMVFVENYCTVAIALSDGMKCLLEQVREETRRIIAQFRPDPALTG